METRALKRPLPLDGIRVLTLEHFGAGPYASLLLAELGAEVVKIEAPGIGDASRHVGPFPLGAADGQYFQTFSRSKKSVALDLKTPEGRADFETLVASADVVMNNLRGDQPRKLRITYSDLSAINPAIVCGHLSAYGRENSREAWPGYDYVMQAECGLMSLTGEPEEAPARMGVSIIDFMTGAVLASGLLAAIVSALRLGKGCDVDVSLFDVALHQLSYPGVWMMNEGYETERLPNGAHPSIAPVQRVETADGYAQLMCMTDAFWKLFCGQVERPDLAADARFETVRDRHQHLNELTEALNRIFRTRPTADWTSRLQGRVPFGPVNSLRDAVDNPFVEEVAMRDRVAHPDLPGGLQMFASPIRIDMQRLPGRRAPKLAENDRDFFPLRGRSG
jgi:crotonobetainyl-CoA:carnitine CoA-transferase CaiB-like acyl-CoA transferase